LDKYEKLEEMIESEKEAVKEERITHYKAY
jgi:hypothetical protein